MLLCRKCLPTSLDQPTGFSHLEKPTIFKIFLSSLFSKYSCHAGLFSKYSCHRNFKIFLSSSFQNIPVIIISRYSCHHYFHPCGKNIFLQLQAFPHLEREGQVWVQTNLQLKHISQFRKYIWPFVQIHLTISICANTFDHLCKYIWPFVQIHLAICANTSCNLENFNLRVNFWWRALWLSSGSLKKCFGLPNIVMMIAMKANIIKYFDDDYNESKYYQIFWWYLQWKQSEGSFEGGRSERGSITHVLREKEGRGR